MPLQQSDIKTKPLKEANEQGKTEFLPSNLLDFKIRPYCYMGNDYLSITSLRVHIEPDFLN